MPTIIDNRYDFVLLTDVTYGNPNGDPDADNMPRIDPETGHGLMTPECLKHKIRRYMSIEKAGEPGYALYISHDKCLNQADLNALIAKGVVPADTPLANLKNVLKTMKKSGNAADLTQITKEAACSMYGDVRMFGGVMTQYQEIGAAQIHGAVQFGFATTIDPVQIQRIALIRDAYTTEAEMEEKGGTGTMGHRYVIPYGLYLATGHINANAAQELSRLSNAGFSEDDLELFKDAVRNMFVYDKAAGRGEMVMRKLIIFKHDSKKGNEADHKLFERVHVVKKPGVTVPRAYTDYEVSVDTTNMPAGVTLEVID